jgi:hypothetical protein
MDERRLSISEEIAEIFKAAQKRMKEYDRRFESGSVSGEYYGRGQLEGMAAALYPLWYLMNPNNFSKEFVAYIEVWGESHTLEKELSPNETH